MQTRKQSGVRRILKVYKERARVCVVNTRSQNSVTNDKCKYNICLYLSTINFLWLHIAYIMNLPTDF